MALPPTSRLSSAMERTGQWVFSQEIPTDVVVVVKETCFSLHKFMLVAKSNYIRTLIMESKEADLTTINISDVPGGEEMFEKAAKFCYGVNFEITVHNVAALSCAAEYLQMTDGYCENNLAGRCDEFLSQVALSNLSGAVIVLKSCEDLLPLAEDIGILQRCIDVASLKACNEANFPSRSPPSWWTNELSILDVDNFVGVICAMKQRGAKTTTIASVLMVYTEKFMRDLYRDYSSYGTTPSATISADSNKQIQQQEFVESIVAVLPSEKTAFPVNFLCSLLRSAIFLDASSGCRNELEKRISEIFEHVTVDDLLVLTFSYDADRLLNLNSVRKVIAAFTDKERNVAVFNGGGFKEAASCSAAMQRVAKTVDTYLGEIATYSELSISKFNGIANLIPKGARKSDDDLYRAVDIFLKEHPDLDEIEREKVCSSMDPLRLSYDARLHASQNKRLPVQIVLHALYYDQLKLRSGGFDDPTTPNAETTRNQLQADVSLMKENETLRTELMKMKLYITDIQTKIHHQGEMPSTSSSNSRKVQKPKSNTFFSSVSKKLGKLNPFRNGSKDTSNLDDDLNVDVTKPRRRRFSIS